MGNRNVFLAPTTQALFKHYRQTVGPPPSESTYYTSGGTVAFYHDLFSQQGYVGPRPKIKPYPIHNFELYYDRINAHEEWLQIYDGTNSYDSYSGPCLNVTPHSVQFLPGLDWSSVYAQALDKFNDKVRGGLDLTVDIAEAGQTAKMLHLTEELKSYTKTFFRKFGAIKTLANLRLQYMYGVKPLLSSIYGCADESVRLVLNKTQHFKARATDYSQKPDFFQIYTYFGFVRFETQSLGLKMSCEIGANLKQNGFDLARFGSLNPVSIAWELMPYSFVVDWVYNVGGYLRALETAVLYNNDFISGYRTNFAAFSGSGVAQIPLSSGTHGHDTITCDVRGVRQFRSILNGYPVPQLPSFRADLGSSRLLNGAALLAQFLGRR